MFGTIQLCVPLFPKPDMPTLSVIYVVFHGKNFNIFHDFLFVTYFFGVCELELNDPKEEDSHFKGTIIHKTDVGRGIHA